MNISENTKRMGNILGGAFLGIIGIILLVYSLYFFIFPPFKKELLSLLPAQNFRILFINTEENPLDVSIISPVIASMLNDDSIPVGITAGYFNPSTQKTEFIHISPSEKPAPRDKKCVESDGYYFCSSGEKLSLVYSILDEKEKKRPTLLDLPSLRNYENVFINNTPVTFLGATTFLQESIFVPSLPLSIPQKENIKRILKTINPSLPLFSGNIDTKTGIYTFAFHKKNSEMIYSSSFSNPFSPRIFTANIDRYMMVQNPSELWKYISENIEISEFPELTNFQSWAKTKISDVFAQKLSWQEDIIPLLNGDLLTYSSPNTASAVFAFPTNELSKKWYEKIVTILQFFAAEKVPTKKEHTLADGSKIYEVFPQKSAISLKKTSIANGEGTEFTAPLEVNEKQFPVTAFSGKHLLISESNEGLSMFLNPDMSVSSFVFPVNENLFFAMGLKARSNEKIPVSFLEILGIEQKTMIVFLGKVEWNTSFFAPKPVEGMIGTPLPTPYASGVPSPKNAEELQ